MVGTPWIDDSSDEDISSSDADDGDGDGGVEGVEGDASDDDSMTDPEDMQLTKRINQESP